MNKIELVEPSNSLEILIINGTNRGLKVAVHVLNKSGAGQTKWSIFMFIISGQGRKRGGACATGAITLQDRKTFNFDGQTQNHNQQKE